MHAVNLDALLEPLDRATFRDTYPVILNALCEKALSLGFSMIAGDIDYIQKRSVLAFRYSEEPSGNPNNKLKGRFN